MCRHVARSMVFQFEEDEYYDRLWQRGALESAIFQSSRGKVYLHLVASYDFHRLCRPKHGICAGFGLLPDGTGAFAVSKVSSQGLRTTAVRICLKEDSHPTSCRLVYDGDPQLSEESLSLLQAFDPCCWTWTDPDDADPYGMAIHLCSLAPNQSFTFDYNDKGGDEDPALVHTTAPGDVVLNLPGSDWQRHDIFRPVAGVELTAETDVLKVVSEAVQASASQAGASPA